MAITMDAESESFTMNDSILVQSLNKNVQCCLGAIIIVRVAKCTPFMAVTPLI